MSELKETGTEKKAFIKKGDIVLIVVLVVVAGVLAVIFMLQGKETGKIVCVTVDGAVYGEYSLYEDREMTIETERGKNRFEIKEGVVKMLAADCPDQYCVKHAAIKTEKDPIVCLPHRVVIEIVTTVQK